MNLPLRMISVAALLVTSFALPVTPVSAADPVPTPPPAPAPAPTPALTRDADILTQLLARSESLTVRHQVTGETSTLARFLADLLLTTHFTLTPSLQCDPEEGAAPTPCMLLFATEPAKTNTEQKPPEDYLGDSTWMLSFNYRRDAAGPIHVVGDELSYRIEQ